MSKYNTIASDYRVLKLNEDGEVIGLIEAKSPLFNFAIDEMVKDFNEMHLEKYLDEEDAVRELGYGLKGKIKAITMKRLEKTDEEGRPFVRITAETVPGTLKLTQKARSFIDDYLSAQFCDGWGEGFFYPCGSFKTADGQILAVE